MGGLFGGGTSKSTQVTDNTPWAAQQPYLTQGMQDAQQIYDQQKSTVGPFTGDFAAGLSPGQTSAINFATGYGTGQGANMPTLANGAAGNLLGQSGNFTNNANALAAYGIGGPNPGLFGTLQRFGTGGQTTAGASPALSDALDRAAVQGANSLNGFTTGLQSAATRASSDPTQQIAGDASTFANNPGVQASIKSTNDLIDQTLNEQTVPGLNRAAAMGGNLNSSRAGMAEALANQGAALAKGNADASILNNAYNSGLNTAGNLYATGLNADVNANTSGLFDVGMNSNNTANRETGLNEFNTTNELGAANSGLNTELGFGLGNANTRLGANQQLGQGLTTGFNGSTTAGNLAAGDYGLLANAGAVQQSGDQAALTNALDKYEMQAQFPWQNLDNYWNVVGRPLGNTQTTTGTTQQSGPGVVGGLLGLGLAGAGLFGSGGMFPGALAGISGLFGPAAGAVGGNLPL